MSDESVIIVDPSGTEHEFPAGFDPRKAALKVRDEYRAAEDVKAVAAQKNTAAGSTFASQMTPSNLLHDAGTVAGAGWDVLKTLVKEGWKNPLGINQPYIKYDPAAHAQDPSLRDKATSALGTLRTLPGRAWATVTDPVGALQSAGVTPDMAAHMGGTVAALGAVGAALPNAGRLTTSAGNQITRAGQAMNPAVTKTLGEGVGALAEAGLGGASASPTMGGLGRVFAGSKIGGAIGEAIPSMTRGTGRLITKAGQFMGSATGTPAGLTPPKPPVQPNTLLRADDLQGMLEEAMAQRDAPTSTTAPPERTVTAGGRPSLTAQEYAELERGSPGAGVYAGASESAYAPNPVTEPTGPPPRLVKGGGPSLQDALITALEDVRQAESGAGTTPPDVTLTEAGKPSVTPERASKIGETAPPAGTTRQIQPEVPPTLPTPGNPIPADDLTAMLEELRQQPANDPATTASGAPPTELTPGGRPSQTQADYDALVEAAQRRQALEKEVSAQTASSAAPAETPAAQAVRDQTAARPAVADEAEAAGVPEEADAGAATGGTTRTPSPAELTPDEVRRKEIGARDFAAEQRRESGVTETPDEVRARTRARTTGQTEQVSTLSTKALNRVVGTLKDMIANGATDAELRDYINNAPGDTAKKAIGVAVNTLLHGTGRDVVGIAGATALTGAALRQALVGQLQGDQKEQD